MDEISTGPAPARSGDEGANDTVYMDGISSNEYLLYEGRDPQQVIKSINLRIKKAECWGITGNDPYAVRLLLEIMGNIRPYRGGTCVLAGRGMMRRKRVVLPHVFYIGGTRMLYDNLNVLEYLMLASATLNEDRVELQNMLFRYLLQIGLRDISLAPVALLTDEQRAVVTLAAASRADSELTIFNFPQLAFGEDLAEAVAEISRHIRSEGRSLTLGTQSCGLIDRACSHTAYIADGRFLYRGTVDELKSRYDKVLVIIKGRNINRMRDLLSLPGYKLFLRDGALYISASDGGADIKRIYDAIAESGLSPDLVEVNPKTVQNAYEELTAPHDI